MIINPFKLAEYGKDAEKLIKTGEETEKIVKTAEEAEKVAKVGESSIKSAALDYAKKNPGRLLAAGITSAALTAYMIEHGDPNPLHAMQHLEHDMTHTAASMGADFFHELFGDSWEYVVGGGVSCICCIILLIVLVLLSKK